MKMNSLNLISFQDLYGFLSYVKDKRICSEDTLSLEFLDVESTLHLVL